MKYQVQIGEKTFNIDLTKYSFEAPRRLGANTWQLFHKNRIYQITTELNKNQVTFWLDGEKITAQVQAGGAGFKPAPISESKGPLTLKSAMPGLVKKIKVKLGDRVEKGQGLLVLEAMKMENEIVAPARSKVETVLVREGHSVESQAPLLKLNLT